MPRIGVVTDSTADFSPDNPARQRVGVVPLVVNWDGQTYRDKVDLTTADFYRRLRGSKSSPSTGAPSLAAFQEEYERQLGASEGVVCLTLSSKLSATYDMATQAAQQVAPDRIRVVDSKSITMGLGWLAQAASELAESGKSLDEVAAGVEALVPRVRIYFTLDSLEYLRRGGRIGRAQALAGTLLNVKPILSIGDGEVHPVERVRTLGAALRRIAELSSTLGPIERLAVMQGDAAESAAELERTLAERLPGVRVERGEIGTVLGTHGGPGVVGFVALLGA